MSEWPKPRLWTPSGDVSMSEENASPHSAAETALPHRSALHPRVNVLMQVSCLHHTGLHLAA